MEHTGCHLTHLTSQIITYLDVAEEMCVCVCVYTSVGLSPQLVQRSTMKWICHYELETLDGCTPS